MKVFSLLVVILLIPAPALPVTYFSHDAETTPICCAFSGSTYQWSESQSLVTRQSNRSKNGTWSLRHRFEDAGSSNQVGKVIKFFDPATGIPTPFPNDEAYFSAWYYFDSASGTVWQDPGNFQIWANHMQWKGDNHSSYQDGSPKVEADVKAVVSMRYINGTRRWLLEMASSKWVASPTTYSETTFASGTFPYQVSSFNEKWANTTFEVPLDEWVFLEAYVKMTKQGGHFKLWSGKASDGVLHLLHDMTHADFNFLKRWDNDPAQQDQWSTNLYLYWGIGNYQDFAHLSGTYDLYTDDAKISSTQVGPTLIEFSQGGGGGGETPPPPRNLAVSRTQASNRSIAAGRSL